VAPVCISAESLKGDTDKSSLDAIRRECNIPHLCGAAALHHTEVFRSNLAVARSIAESLSTWLPATNYTALHIRAGGSLVDIGGPVNAVPWHDGHDSDIPQWWIDGFRKSLYQTCHKNLAVVSDSARVLSELQYAVQDRLVIAHCCAQALHRDRYMNKAFFFQEVVDLFILARSRQIVGGMGGFSRLGKYWLGGKGPELVIVKSAQDMNTAMHNILTDAQCSEIEVVL
jgi:hypothetical protein